MASWLLEAGHWHTAAPFLVGSLMDIFVAACTASDSSCFAHSSSRLMVCTVVEVHSLRTVILGNVAQAACSILTAGVGMMHLGLVPLDLEHMALGLQGVHTGEALVVGLHHDCTFGWLDLDCTTHLEQPDNSGPGSHIAHFVHMIDGNLFVIGPPFVESIFGCRRPGDSTLAGRHVAGLRKRDCLLEDTAARVATRRRASGHTAGGHPACGRTSGSLDPTQRPGSGHAVAVVQAADVPLATAPVDALLPIPRISCLDYSLLAFNDCIDSFIF